jgi:hypothetical protein
MRALSWIRRHHFFINTTSGALLAGVGVLLLLGKWTSVTIWMEGAYGNLA